MTLNNDIHLFLLAIRLRKCLSANLINKKVDYVHEDKSIKRLPEKGNRIIFHLAKSRLDNQNLITNTIKIKKIMYI